VQLAEAVKHGASSLGSGQPDSQVMVMNAVKDVAAALGELINATKLASGKPIHDPAMNDLKESAKVRIVIFFVLSNSMFFCNLWKKKTLKKT
jgi:talin